MALLFSSWLLELAAVLTTIFAGVYILVHHKFNYWKQRGVPHLQPSFPFGNLTSAFLMTRSMGEVYQDIYQRLVGHKLVGVYNITAPSLMIRDPEYIKNILVKDFAHFHDHGTYYDEESDPLSAHLFSLEGTKWKHLRYKLSPTFTSGKMKMMFPTVVECGVELQKYLVEPAKHKETIEVKDLLAKYSTDVIASCAFGIQTNSLQNPDSEFRLMGRKIFQPSLLHILRDMCTFLVPSIAALLKIPSVPHDVATFFRGVVAETVDYREKNDVVRNDFMQLLIKIKNKKSVTDDDENMDSENYYDVHGMTVDEVAAQAFVFLFGGLETSAGNVSFVLYALATNQDVQDRLRDEVDSVLADHGGQFTYEAMMDMTYLDKVIAETLRMYPPAFALFRTCTSEYRVPDSELVIAKGTSVIIPVSGLHHDPQYFPDPQRFDPERFNEEAKNERHRYTYLPFGEGPRICIGQRFALMLAKVAIASLIVKYQLNVCKKLTAIPIQLDSKALVLTAKGGIHLQIIDRN